MFFGVDLINPYQQHMNFPLSRSPRNVILLETLNVSAARQRDVIILALQRTDRKMQRP
jgi:hypothetical protein